jgi:hypothetical protein
LLRSCEKCAIIEAFKIENYNKTEDLYMKLKKALSCVIAAAMMFSLAAVMTTGVGAAALPDPTYDATTGGWTVNHFVRTTGAAGENLIGIYPYGVEQGDLDAKNTINLVLPEGKAYADVRFIQVEFNFPADLEIEEIPVMVIVTNSDIGGWQEHKVHACPVVQADNALGRCNSAARSACNNTCVMDVSGANPTALITTNFSDVMGMSCEWMNIVFIADWDLDDGRTPGSAKVTLLDANKNLLGLSVFGGDPFVPPTVTTTPPPSGPLTPPPGDETKKPEETKKPDDEKKVCKACKLEVCYDSAVCAAAIAAMDDDDAPKGGVVFAIVPAVMALGTAVVFSRKRK